MAQLSLTLGIRKRWFFTPAVWIAAVLIALEVIRDVPNVAYHDGVMPAAHRVAEWLARFAFRFEVA